jgi:hypothetical protein
MALEVWDAERLGGILMGLEDVKKELIGLTQARQEGDPTKYVNELVEAAERWDALQEELQDWPDE